MKQLECPRCKQASESYQWNKRTKDYFGENILSIERYINEPGSRIAKYICPCCNKTVQFVYEKPKEVVQ